MAEAHKHDITDETERLLWGITSLIPVVGSDAVFSAMTSTLAKDQARAFRGLPDGLVRDLTERKTDRAQDVVIKEYLTEN